jgi:hypothetical protein
MIVSHRNQISNYCHAESLMRSVHSTKLNEYENKHMASY